MEDPILTKLNFKKEEVKESVTQITTPLMTTSISSLTPSVSSSPVVIAEKDMFIGSIHGFAENGGETPMEGGWAVRFVRTSDKFMKVQLLSYGKGVKPKTQFWNKKSSRKPKATTVKTTQTKIGKVENY